MRYIKFLVVPLLFVTLAFMNIGGCGSSGGGGKNKEGCCVFGENDCDDDLAQLECDFEGGVLDEGDLCVDVPECGVVLNGEILYMDNCQECHGDGAEYRSYAALNRWTSIAEETDTAIMEVPLMMTPSLEALTPEEIDAIADFLSPQ